jgi:signal transduction histidine kinase
MSDTIPHAGRSRWERWDEALINWIGYVLLAIPVVVATIVGRATAADTIANLLLAAIAAGWIFLLFTRSPKPCREHPLRIGVYFTGLLLIGGVLTARQPIFLVFLITGFFHASLLRPFPLPVVGVFATSVSIHVLVTGFPWQTVDQWILFGTIIVVQTAAIGFGIYIGERLTEVSRERQRAVERLEAALEENAALQAQLVAQAREAGVLDERSRMAREIHDTIAHGLTGIVTQLEAARQLRDRPEAFEHVDNAAALARESLAEARRSVEASRPGPLEHASLPDALEDIARRWSAINHVPAEVVTTGDPVPLHPEIETALLRTVQEALANVARHARATRVAVTLSFMGDVVTLDVRDDGAGFDITERSASTGSGFGLTAMRQRVGRVAGTLAVESEPGTGTAISARVPAIGPQPAGGS